VISIDYANAERSATERITFRIAHDDIQSLFNELDTVWMLVVTYSLVIFKRTVLTKQRDDIVIRRNFTRMFKSAPVILDMSAYRSGPVSWPLLITTVTVFIALAIVLAWRLYRCRQSPMAAAHRRHTQSMLPDITFTSLRHSRAHWRKMSDSSQTHLADACCLDHDSKQDILLQPNL
jgi:hypothetical protein